MSHQVYFGGLGAGAGFGISGGVGVGVAGGIGFAGFGLGTVFLLVQFCYDCNYFLAFAA